jgi:sensor histidine kinase YesM
MTDTATLDRPRPARRFPWRRFATDACWMLLLVVICAVIITWSFGDGTGFGINLLVSACIGTIAFAIIDGARLAFWGEAVRPHWLAFAGLIAVGVPVGQIAGARVAGWLLGQELTSLHTLGSGRTTGMLVFTLLATGAVTLFFASRDRLARAEAAAAQERARAEAVERQALQAQLQRLQAQIEPHMLFNTLANLQGLIALDPERAQQMLDQLIQYLRATLSSSRAQRTTLAQEFALLQAYLGLMSVRMGARLSYAFDLPDALRAVEIAPMLLQPLVENAIAHGLEPKIEGGHLAVEAQLSQGMLTLTVRDNGRGPDAGPGKPGTSLGLSNTRARLDVLFGARAAATLLPADAGGAVACIAIPLEQDKP